MTIDDIMRRATVIPVLVLDGTIDPTALAETLVEAGLPVLEVTLRTPQALDAIRAMARVPGAVVGAGTVLNPAMLDEAIAAGSHFIVSPGLTQRLADAAIATGVPFLPGVANPGLRRWRANRPRSLCSPIPKSRSRFAPTRPALLIP